MKVSIITVAYNSAQTIADTITSVLSQTYNDIEYIIIDGASSDNTLEIIGSFQNDNIKIVSERDKGIYDAMNKGILMATGEVIGILNSDDVYQDDKVVEEIMAQFNAEPKLDLVYGNLVYVKSDNLNKVVRKWKSRPPYPHFFEHGHVPPHPTLYVRKKVYKKTGLFDLRYQLAADYELMLRLFKLFDFNIRYIPRLMVKMRLGGATNKNAKNMLNGNREIISAWKSNGFKAPFYLMPLRVVKRLLQFI